MVFPTELEALRAVNKHLLAYFNGHLVRDGERCGSAKARAELHFKRPVEGERKAVVGYPDRGRAWRLGRQLSGNFGALSRQVSSSDEA